MNITPFLMFEGKAEEAMTFYTSLFSGSKIEDIVRYGAGGPGPEGSVMKASFVVAGQRIMCTDSFVKHGFTFTPSFSLWVECDSEDDVRRLSPALSDGGKVLMPPDNYGFSKLFTWVSDRFGISWQLNKA